MIDWMLSKMGDLGVVRLLRQIANKCSGSRIPDPDEVVKRF